MKILLLIPFLMLVSCKKDVSATMYNEKAMQAPVKDSIMADLVSEVYIDSTLFGVKGNYKLELKKIIGNDSTYVDIQLFEKKNNKWAEKQHFALEKDGISDSSPEYKDFNNDGYNDLTFQSSIAARGANEIKSLYLFDPKAGKLKFIKNSPDYPNIQYNEKLDCVDSFAVYGGSTSYFLKIDNDTLRQFARVDLFDGYREIYKTDKKGKEILIKKEPFEASYIRYKNFDPLEEYEDF